MPAPVLVTVNIEVVLANGAQLIALYLADGQPVTIPFTYDSTSSKWEGNIDVDDLGANGPFEHAVTCHIRGPKGASAKFSGDYIDSTGTSVDAFSSNVVTRALPTNSAVYRDGVKTVFFEIK